jgi:hypothetical protein
MARFQSRVAFVVAGKRYKAGTIYADTVGNALAGDVVWAGMSSSTMSPGLIALDGTATTMKGASPSSGLDVARPDGVNSIDG